MSRFAAATTPFGELPSSPDGGHDPQAAFDAGKSIFLRTRALFERVAGCNALKAHPALQAALLSGMLSNQEMLTVGSCNATLRKCAIGSLRTLVQESSSNESQTPLATNCDPVVRFGMWAFANRSLLRSVRSVKVNGVRSSGASILLGALALSPCALEEISGAVLAPGSELPTEVAEALMAADPVQQLALEHKFGAPVFLWNTSEQGLVVQDGSAATDSPVFKGGADTLCSDHRQLLRGVVAHPVRVLPGLIHAKCGSLQRAFSEHAGSADSDQHAAVQDMYVATPLAFHCQGLTRADICMPLQLGGPLKGAALVAVANRRSLKDVSVYFGCDVECLEDGAQFEQLLLCTALDGGCEQADVRAALNKQGGASSSPPTAHVPQSGSPLSPLTWLSGLETLRADVDVYMDVSSEPQLWMQAAELERAAVQCVAQCIRDNAGTLTTVEVRVHNCCMEAYGGEGGVLAALATCERLKRLTLSVTPIAMERDTNISTNKSIIEGEIVLNAAQLGALRASWVMPAAQREAAAAAAAAFLRSALQRNAASLEEVNLKVLDGNACVAFLEAAPALQGVRKLVLSPGGMLDTLEYALDVSGAAMQETALEWDVYSPMQQQQPTLGALTPAQVPALELLPQHPQIAVATQATALDAMREDMLHTCAAWLAALHGVGSMTGLHEATLSVPTLWHERQKFWPAGDAKPCSALEHLELTALQASAAAGNLRTLVVHADELVQPAVLNAFGALTAAGADCIEDVHLKSFGRGYDLSTEALTQQLDVAGVNGCLRQLRRLKKLRVRQTLQVAHVDAGGVSVLQGLSFYGHACELVFDGLMTAADVVALGNMFASQEPGVRFTKLDLDTGHAIEHEIMPSAQLFEGMWAGMSAAPSLRTLADVSVQLPSHALGCPSALPALLGWRHLQELSLKPHAGGMRYVELSNDVELGMDADDMQHQRYTSALSCVQRSLRSMQEAGTLQGAMQDMFGAGAHALEGVSGNNAQMSKQMQMLCAAGAAAAAPVGCELAPLSLLVRLLEEPHTPADAATYHDGVQPAIRDMRWAAQHVLQAAPAAPDASCTPEEGAACTARREAAAAGATAFLQQHSDAELQDEDSPRLKSALNLLLAHAVNVACAALPSEVLRCAAGGHWQHLAVAELTVPILQRQELLQWARIISPAVGAGSVRTSLSAYHCDWRGGQGSVDAMGYGAAVAFPAPNLEVMLPQGHATPAQDAADAMDVYPEHVLWFRMVAPIAAWGREQLVKGSACSEGNNFGAAQSLEKLMHLGELMDTPVYNCFGSDFDLSTLVDFEPEGLGDAGWGDDDEDDEEDDDDEDEEDEDY